MLRISKNQKNLLLLWVSIALTQVVSADETYQELFRQADAHGKDHCPICMISADGTQMRVIANLGEGKYAGSPRLSPDGKVIAFDSWFSDDTGASQAHLYTVGVDGANLKEATLGSMPSWLPTAKLAEIKESEIEDKHRFLAFFRHGRDFGLWTIALDGSQLTQLNRNGNSPRFSPEGKRLAYVKLGANGGIVVTPLKEKAEHRLIAPNRTPDSVCVYMHGFDWSPDGTKIVAQCQTARDEYEVRIIDVKKEETRSLNLVTSNSFSWSPDGKQILCTATKGKFRKLYTFDPTEDEPTLKVVPGLPQGRHNGDGVWTVDGKRVIFTSESPNDD